MIDAVNRCVNMQISVKIFNCPEFAAGIEQATHNQMTEHLVFNGVVANLVIKGAIDQFRTEHPHLGVGQC